MKKNKFILFEIMIALAICMLLAIFLLPRIAKAQPYFTNPGTIYGAQTYNQAYPTPLKPSQTLANQYSAGTLAGSITAGLIPNVGFYTNTFATNIFSTAPFVVCTASATNAIPGVVSTSPTNFVVQLLNTNATLYWEATGH